MGIGDVAKVVDYLCTATWTPSEINALAPLDTATLYNTCVYGYAQTLLHDPGPRQRQQYTIMPLAQAYIFTQGFRVSLLYAASQVSYPWLAAIARPT